MPEAKKRIIYSNSEWVAGVREVDGEWYAMYRDRRAGTNAAPRKFYWKLDPRPCKNKYEAQHRLNEYVKEHNRKRPGEELIGTEREW